MTDKEIIIDGKGCRYKTWDKDCALTGDNHGDNMKPCKFIDENNCYYKQLKRKKQECEKLKNEYWKLEQDNDFLAEKNSRLKGCLAEIKEIAEPFCNACQEFEPEKKGSNCMYCNYGIILRKISEVEKQ